MLKAIDKAKDHADAAIAESKDASGKAMDKATEATRILDKAAQAAREVLDKAKTATSEVLDKAKEATKDMGSKGKPEDDKPVKPPPPDSLSEATARVGRSIAQEPKRARDVFPGPLSLKAPGPERAPRVVSPAQARQVPPAPGRPEPWRQPVAAAR